MSDYTNPGDTPQSDYDKAEIRRLRAELEKARGERDSSRTILRKWVGQLPDTPSGLHLRSCIAKELES